jgi:D-glycero-D-manno-heptose 1,7-bisphosphate phosphatase
MIKLLKNITGKNKALFLDRDGVINEDYGHVYQINKFHLIKNIHSLIKRANVKNYKVIVVTNQAGIGKQLFSEDDFQKLNDYMKDFFLKKNCYIDAVYHCPYHPSNDVGKYLGHSYDRKPNPGMLLKAQKDFNLDMAKSIFIGDKISDMKAGNNALVKTNILFNKDKNQNQNKSSGNFIEINCLKEALKYL